MVMEDNESCGSRVSESAAGKSRQQRRKEEVYTEISRRLKEANHPEAQEPNFDDHLLAHFNRLPARYAMDMNPERAEDVLTHKRLLQLARDPANRPVFDVRLVQVHVADGDAGDSVHSRPLRRGRPMHEITFSTLDKPKLLTQLTSLLPKVGLNIQEAHAFSTGDGYSLDVFVVDGWSLEEVTELRIAVQKELANFEMNVEAQIDERRAVEGTKTLSVDEVNQIFLSINLITDKHRVYGVGSAGPILVGQSSGSSSSSQLFTQDQVEQLMSVRLNEQKQQLMEEVRQQMLEQEGRLVEEIMRRMGTRAPPPPPPY